MRVNYHVRSVHSDLEEGRNLASDSFVTWRDVADHIRRRWAQVRTQRIALSTKKGGTGVHGVVAHPQSRNSFEAGKGSVISKRRLSYLSPVPEGSK